MHAYAAPRPAQRHSSPVLVLTMFAVVLAALAFGAWQYLRADEPRGPDPLVPEGAHLRGDKSAPVTIVVFSDFLCSDCAALARDVFPGLQQDFIDEGVARLVFRHYPTMGKDSVRAAVAAECAGRQRKFWEMHDVLFGWQGAIGRDAYSSEMLKQLALGFRVNHREFTACLGDPSMMIAIERDLAQGVALGIDRLPAVFVNGESAGPAPDDTRIRSLVVAAAKVRWTP